MSNPPDAHRVPLTFTQHARLMAECLPVVFFTLILIFLLTRFQDLTGEPPSLFVILFLCTIILVVGWAAVNSIRDMLSGVALIQEDVLELAWRSGKTLRSRPLNGKFTQLGKMRLSTIAYLQGINSFRYRVTYSPASRIVWSLEKVD